MSSLYRQVLAADFAALAPELQQFHDTLGTLELHGRCRVDGPDTWLGRVFGAVFGLPGTCAETDLRFELTASPTEETWVRHFPGRAMRSCMHVRDGELRERLGPVMLHFNLQAGDGRLAMLLRGITISGLSWPRMLMPTVIAEEHASTGKLYFNVAASLRGVGLLVAYRGHLVIPGTDPA